MIPLGYRIYDADNHYYEPDDCFTRHIESRQPRKSDLGLRLAMVFLHRDPGATDLKFPGTSD
jgi:hypothetical protein